MSVTPAPNEHTDDDEERRVGHVCSGWSERDGIGRSTWLVGSGPSGLVVPDHPEQDDGEQKCGGEIERGYNPGRGTSTWV